MDKAGMVCVRCAAWRSRRARTLLALLSDSFGSSEVMMVERMTAKRGITQPRMADVMPPESKNGQSCLTMPKSRLNPTFTVFSSSVCKHSTKM